MHCSSKLFTSARLLCLSQQPTAIRTPTSRLFQRHSGGNSGSLGGQSSRRTNISRLEPVEQQSSHQLFGGPVKQSTLWRPLVFTATFTAGTFVTVSIWEYENLVAHRLSRNSVEWFRNRINAQQQRQSDALRSLRNWWNSLTPGERVFVPICALNLAVFAAWRVPALKTVMMTYFASNPAARAVCWPMLLSTFSHYSAFHIFANMYVLHSFANAGTMSLGTEQFVGLYLTAGVVSSLASYLMKTTIGAAGMSLGASGALMGILAYVCSKYPETELGILFLPTLTFSAGAAIKVMMGVDLAGCLLGWRFFDHAAHLGGACVGIFWCFYGAQNIWPKRIHVQQYWHQLRAK